MKWRGAWGQGGGAPMKQDVKTVVQYFLFSFFITAHLDFNILGWCDTSSVLADERCSVQCVCVVLQDCAEVRCVIKSSVCCVSS